VVTVASRAHYRGRLDLQAVADPNERITPTASYARSKLANVMHSLALARRLRGTGIAVNSLHPGIVASNLLPQWLQWVQRWLKREQMFDPVRGARTTLQLALDPRFQDCSGLYVDENGQPEPPSPIARDEALQEQLWMRSLAWTGAGGTTR
jgi:NAD(P)-dependent dehydrogenase (short-subunit alcohol dehydrogenase family)